MRRLTIDPRPGWQKRVEKYGFYYHTLKGEAYWDESACYQFTAHEIDSIELATEALHTMCLELVQEVIDKRLFGLFLIPKEFEEYVIRSWEKKEPSVYGRFDLAFDGVGAPKMLEYNADTPTALLEAAVAQWDWLKDVDERGDQFNSIHERLIDAWKAVRERDGGPIHFAAMTNVDSPEDYITAEYMRDTAIQAGLQDRPSSTSGTSAGIAPATSSWITPASRSTAASSCTRGSGSSARSSARTSEARRREWVEPAWKMILSCKSILPLLYERHPDSPFLLPASFDPLPVGQLRAQADARPRGGEHPGRDRRAGSRSKPTGRIRAAVHVPGARDQLKPHDGRYPGDRRAGSSTASPAGMGIREDDSLVTRQHQPLRPAPDGGLRMRIERKLVRL